MGLREDMEILENYNQRGLGKEYMQGTLTKGQREESARDRNRMPSDPSARMSMNSPGWEAARGD